MLERNDTSKTLSFDPILIPNDFSTGVLSPILILSGSMENEENFSDEIILQESLIIHPKILFNGISNTLDPDSIIQGQAVNFSMSVEHNSSYDFILNKNLTSITIYSENETLSSAMTGDSLFSHDQNNIITFSTIEFDSNQQLGNYGIYVDYAGSTVNGIQFSNRDSLESSSLNVITPPQINYEYGLQPKNLIIGEGIQFQFFIENLGMSELILDTSTVLYFSDSENYFYSNLASKTKIYPDASNQLLIFNEMYIPQEFQLGSYMCYLNISGKSVDDADFYQNDILIDSISVGRGGAPSIKNIRYVDGGYINIPDGQINEGDIIKIKFSERLNASLLTGKSADRYFLFVTENDRFGASDSSIVVNSNTVSYSGSDSDSTLHVILGSDAILANSSATNRLLELEGGETNTLIRAENNPSLIIINPDIKMEMIEGEIGSDVGYPTNRDSLNNQINQISSENDESLDFSKFALLVDDQEPPVLVNFFPQNSTSVSNFTPVKGFITGRNLIYTKDLLSMISNYPQLGIQENDIANNPYLLPQKLIAAKNNNLNISNLLFELMNYRFEGLSSDVGDSLVTINPLKQMFTSISGLPKYTYNDIGEKPVTLNGVENSYITFDNSFEVDHNTGLDNIVSSNFEIIHDPFNGGNNYFWFEINTILNYQNSHYNFLVKIENSDARINSDENNYIWSAPNPYQISSNEKMVIEYELPESVQNIEIVIIDGNGGLVMKWSESTLGLNAGRHRIMNGWSGKNLNGQKVSPGMYLLILSVSSETKSTWMLAIR